MRLDWQQGKAQSTRVRSSKEQSGIAQKSLVEGRRGSAHERKRYEAHKAARRGRASAAGEEREHFARARETRGEGGSAQEDEIHIWGDEIHISACSPVGGRGASRGGLTSRPRNGRAPSLVSSTPHSNPMMSNHYPPSRWRRPSLVSSTSTQAQ